VLEAEMPGVPKDGLERPWKRELRDTASHPLQANGSPSIAKPRRLRLPPRHSTRSFDRYDEDHLRVDQGRASRLHLPNGSGEAAEIAVS